MMSRTFLCFLALVVLPQQVVLAIPIQPIGGAAIGCSPPATGACVLEQPGEWFGTVGNDTVRVWVAAGGTAIDSVKIAVNHHNCAVVPRFGLARRWVPAKPLGGAGLPTCTFAESAACAPPAGVGFVLDIEFPTASCGNVSFAILDPAGRSFCPAPCPALDDYITSVLAASWGQVRTLYR